MFLITDATLNVYFMWSVKTKLIANGLTKYKLVNKKQPSNVDRQWP